MSLQWFVGENFVVTEASLYTSETQNSRVCQAASSYWGHQFLLSKILRWVVKMIMMMMMVITFLNLSFILHHSKALSKDYQMSMQLRWVILAYVLYLWVSCIEKSTIKYFIKIWIKIPTLFLNMGNLNQSLALSFWSYFFFLIYKVGS